MERDIQFGFRVNDNERRAIADLAIRLQRSQSDAIRFVVVEAARQLAQTDLAPVIPLRNHEAQDGQPRES